MKKIIILLGILCFSWGYSFAVKYTITTVGTSFSPATTTAQVGDTIEFTLTGIHTATQVDQNTWNANSNTPVDGGFNFSGGTSFYVLKASDAGTIYFVCTPHASIGMKGMIEVQNATNIRNDRNAESEITVFPNPVKKGGNILITFPYAVQAVGKIITLDGKELQSFKIVDAHSSVPITFDNGMYILQITYNDKIFVRKIVVE